MTALTQGNNAVTMHTGAVINGVATEAEVLMARHTPKDWPSMALGLDRWERLCEALQAEDHTMPIKAIFMSPTTGGLYNSIKTNGKVNNGVVPTRTALQHLLSFTGAGADLPASACDNLEWQDPDVRAIMLQRFLSKAKDRTVVMRTAIDKDAMVVRAVTSELHSQEYGDDLATIQQLRGIVHKMPQAVMRVVKQWDNTLVEVVIPNKVREVKKGVVVQSRINITNSETKGGCYEASVGTLNLFCLNGAVGSGASSTVTVRHMGDIRTKMRAAMITVVELADVYLEEYHNAYRAELPVSQADAIARTVKRFKLPEATGAALGTLWNVDGAQSAGHTVAGLANALTRYAQSLPIEKALVMETVAGKVIADGRNAFL